MKKLITKNELIVLIVSCILLGALLHYRSVNLKDTENIPSSSDNGEFLPLDTVPGDVQNEDFATNPDILGNKEDLVYFSIWPNSVLPKQIVSYRGSVKGGYFFEANILIGVADKDKNMILQSNGVAKTDWMTSDAVEFEGYLDFSTIPSGEAYVVIHNDNASGLPENDKAIYIPVIIQ